MIGTIKSVLDLPHTTPCFVAILTAILITLHLSTSVISTMVIPAHFFSTLIPSTLEAALLPDSTQQIKMTGLQLTPAITTQLDSPWNNTKGRGGTLAAPKQIKTKENLNGEQFCDCSPSVILK